MEVVALAILGIAFVVQMVSMIRKAKAEKKLPVEMVTVCLLAVSIVLIVLRRFGV